MMFIKPIVDWVFGYDFFISYGHKDGLRYAQGLSEQLKERPENFVVHLDQDEYNAGDNLGVITSRRIRNSKELVVVARQHSLIDSQWVFRECEIFLDGGNLPIIVDVNDSIRRYARTQARKQALIESGDYPCRLVDLIDQENWLMERDNVAGVPGFPDDGIPSPEVVEGIARGFKSTRQEAHRLRFFSFASVVFLSISLVVIWQLFQIQSKNEGLSKAESTALANLAIERLGSGDPTDALSLLDRAIWSDDGVLRNDTPQVDVALLSFYFNPHPVAVFRSHEGKVGALDINAEKSLVASADDKGRAFVWDANSLSVLSELPPHQKEVRDIRISPSGKSVITTSEDQFVRRSAVDTGALESQKRIGGAMARTVDINSQYETLVLMPMADQKDVLIADESKGWKFVGKLVHPEIVSSAAFSEDGVRIVTVSSNKLRIWKTIDCLNALCEPERVLNGHFREIRDAQFGETSTRLASVSSDATLKIWDLGRSPANSLQASATLDPGKHNKQLYERSLDSVQFSNDGALVIAGAGDHTARIWSSDNAKELAVLSGHTGRVTQSYFIDSGQRSITASEDTTVRIWDHGRGFESKAFQVEAGRVSHAVFSKNGRYVYGVAGGQIFKIDLDNGDYIWNVSLLEIAKDEKATSFASRSISTNKDETLLVVASQKHVFVLSTDTAELIRKLPVHSGKVMWAEFSPEENTILTAGGQDNNALILDSVTGNVIKQFREEHTDWVEHATFHPSGKYVLTSSRDGRAIVWEVATEKAISIMKEHPQWVFHSTFFDDGNKVMTQSNEQTAIWDWRNNRLESVIVGHEKLVYHGTVHPTLDVLATAGQGGSALLWTVEGRPLAQLTSHSASIRSLSFSDSGDKLVTTSDDGSLRIWNTSTRLGRARIRALCVALKCR